jgi:hypothetical protein
MVAEKICTERAYIHQVSELVEDTEDLLNRTPAPSADP